MKSMPQLMPLYWVVSTVFVLFLMMMMVKMYGNYTILEDKMLKLNVINEKNEWYW